MTGCNSTAPFDPSSLPDLSGKVYLITGGNAGIGYQTALSLAQHRATIYIGCRSQAKGQAAITSIHSLFPEAKLRLLILDHMDLSSVVAASKNFTSQQPKLHGLINNAGIMAVPFEKSKDGYESQWQTNYLSHWVLTYHLLPTLLATAKGSKPGDVRIVNVTSMGHAMAPKGGIDFEDINQEKGGLWSRYGQSKLGNILHAEYLNSLYGPNGSEKEQGEIWTAAVHPGNVYTDLNRNARFLGRLSPMVAALLNATGVYITPEQGAYTSLFCAASEEFRKEESGKYFIPLGKEKLPSKYALDEKLAVKLWEWTEEEMVKSVL